jgi:hypothetical protein
MFDYYHWNCIETKKMKQLKKQKLIELENIKQLNEAEQRARERLERELLLKQKKEKQLEEKKMNSNPHINSSRREHDSDDDVPIDFEPLL